MNKKKLPMFLVHALSVLNFASVKELPTDEQGKLALNDEQEKKLQAEFPNQFDALKSKAQESLDAELGADAEALKAREEANASLAQALTGNKDSEASLESNAEAAAARITEQAQVIEQLKSEPVADEKPVSMSTIKNAAVTAFLAASSATHLFGITAKEFSMDRPWNQRAALEFTGKQAAQTDFSDASTITNLNEDLKAYYTKNPEVLRELKKDTFGLPAFWPKRFNVVNEITDAVIDVANVTQGRKPEWSPNPDFMIGAEKRKNYPVQIDVEFSGYQLQQLETSWLNSIFDMNGSSPYKLSFVAYLVKMIDQQARLEDRISSINGVYVFKPKGITARGSYLNRQNGLRYQLWKFRDIDKKIVPYRSQMGPLNNTNAYDYLNGMAKGLPNDIRVKTGMAVYMSPTMLNAYQEGYKQANAMHQDYTGNAVNFIEGFSNLEIVPLLDLEGSNVVFLTDKTNIEILENVPNEKSIYRMEYLKRNTYIHADYYQSASFVFAGFRLPENSPFLGQAQFIWVNDAPLFSEEFKVPMYGAPLGVDVPVDFNRIKTDIHLLSDVVSVKTSLAKGMLVKIEGNTAQLTTAKLLKKTAANGGNLELTKDFDPKSGGTLTLIVTENGLKEVARTDAPAAPSSNVAGFTGANVDATYNSKVKYTGDAAADLGSIVGGIEGAELTIYGNADHAFTVKSVAGQITLTGGDAKLDAPEKSLTLKKFDGQWFEISRG